MATLTIRLDAQLEAALNRLAEETKRSKSDLVREMLRRQLAVEKFREARRQLLSLGEQAGYITDDDVFRDIS